MVDFLGILHPRGFQRKAIYSSFIQEKGVDKELKYENLEVFSSKEPFVFFRHLKIIFEGTIYNRKNLCDALHQGGTLFAKELCDEELIGYTYQLWQDRFFEHIQGDFFCFIFNEKNRTLLINRDPLGKKPIYWSLFKGRFFISTQLKMLLSTGFIPQTPSLIGCSSYLHFGYIPQDFSPIKNIFKLLPGHFLKLSLNCEYALQQYFSYSSLFKEKKVDEKESIDKILAHFNTFEQKIHAYDNICLFSQNEENKQLLKSFLSHKRVSCFSRDNLINSDPLMSIEEIEGILPSVIWDLEEPIASLDALLYAAFIKKFKTENSFLLFDIGATEITGLSARFDLSKQVNYLVKPSIYQKIAHLPPAYFSFFLRLFNLVSSRKKWKLLRHKDLLSKQEIYSLYSSLFKNIRRKEVSPVLYPYFDPEIFIQRFHRLSSISGEVDPLLYFDMKTKVPDKDLLQVNKIIANSSFKYDMPFVELPLIDLFAHIPEKFKHNNSSNLMHKLAAINPIQNSTFLDKRYLENYRPLFKKLEKGFLVEEGLISKYWLDKQLLFPEFSEETFYQLWSVLTLEIWFRLFINTPVFLIDKQVQEMQT